MKIKKHSNVKDNFPFRLATKEETKAIIKDLPTHKTTANEIPINILQRSDFCFDKLTIFVNHTLINGKFPAS